MILVKKFPIFLAALSFLLTVISCEKEVEVESLPKQPAGYQELLTVYATGDKYLSTTFGKTSTIVVFENRVVTIPYGGVKINDCRNCMPAAISLADGGDMWLINGTLSGVKYHKRLTDEQATVVYAYIDNTTLYMRISNGSRLEFAHNEKAEAREFTMPIVRITHNASSITKDTYVEGSISIEDADCTYSMMKTFKGGMKIKGRGNSTWGMPKKPYKIKLDEKVSILGMPANKDWALLANYCDKSLVRNATAMEISRRLGFKWTPNSRPVEVYMNDNYLGVYDLFEHKEVAKNKVNIKKDEYYLEIEQAFDEPRNFYTSKGVPIQLKNPEDATDEQFKYIKDYMNEFESVLFGSNFNYTNTGYAKYIDVDSFIDNFIIEELAKDIDGNVRKSSFLTLAEGGKLEFYHQWDFDLSFGNTDYFPDGNNGPTGWWVKDYSHNSWKDNKGWYQRLFLDQNFVIKLQKRWEEVYPELTSIPEYIDLIVSEMGDAPDRNFQKWKILNVYVWPNVKVTGSYEKEVQYLKEFYSERLEWMNNAIKAL